MKTFFDIAMILAAVAGLFCVGKAVNDFFSTMTKHNRMTTHNKTDWDHEGNNHD
jgi:hypothetical protein